MGFEGAQSKMFELMRRVRRKEFRKRLAGRCMLSLSPRSQIALKFFSTVIPAKKPIAKKVNAINNKLLRTTLRYICTETSSVLYKQQIGTYYPVGSEKVIVTQDEISHIKMLQNPGMTLMGFKPRSYLRVYHNIKHSIFATPDDSRIKGSS